VSGWKMAIAAAGSALVLAACGGSSGDNSGSTSCSSPQGGSTSGTGTTTVKVVSDPNTIGKFDPSTVSIKTGDTVEWDFQDSSINHSVTSDETGVFDSCLQNAGAKFVVTFTKAGDFKYHCTIHAQMTGDVKVG
jgi:plastocyanin